MGARVDSRDAAGIAEAVEAQCTGQADNVAAIDQPLAEAAIPLGDGVEMNPGRVLV